MNIIFGKEAAEKARERNTVLELDTFAAGPNKTVTCYCVVSADSLSLNNISKQPKMIELHQALLEGYRNQNWDFCLQAIEHLSSYWGNDMKTFYDILKERIEGFVKNPPPKDWSYIMDTKT